MVVDKRGLADPSSKRAEVIVLGNVPADLIQLGEGDDEPWRYTTLQEIEAQHWEEASRFVQDYEPEHELVVVLLKPTGVKAYWMMGDNEDDEHGLG